MMMLMMMTMMMTVVVMMMRMTVAAVVMTMMIGAPRDVQKCDQRFFAFGAAAPSSARACPRRPLPAQTKQRVAAPAQALGGGRRSHADLVGVWGSAEPR